MFRRNPSIPVTDVVHPLTEVVRVPMRVPGDDVAVPVVSRGAPVLWKHAYRIALTQLRIRAGQGERLGLALVLPTKIPLSPARRTTTCRFRCRTTGRCRRRGETTDCTALRRRTGTDTSLPRDAARHRQRYRDCQTDVQYCVVRVLMTVTPTDYLYSTAVVRSTDRVP